MKKFTLFLLLFIIVASVFAQRVDQVPAFKMNRKIEKFNKYDITPLAPLTRNSGDTIYFYDMSDTSGWNVGVLGATTNTWEVGTPTTNMTDYMGDLSDTTYHTSGDPMLYVDGITFLLTSNYQESNTYIETPVLDFSTTNDVLMKWKQIYKAYNQDSAIIEISIDGGATYPIYIEMFANVLTNSYAENDAQLNITQYVANQPNVKIRFRWYGPETVSGQGMYGSGYGWQIDDILFIEAYKNELEITDIYPGFNYTNTGTYQYVPYSVYCDYDGDGNFDYAPMPMRVFMGAVIFNNGVNPATNVKLHVTVQNEAQTRTYYDEISDTTITSIPMTTRDSLGMDVTNQLFSFNGWATGDSVLPIGKYKMTFEVQSDSTDEIPDNNTDEFAFNISTNYYAIDDGDTSRFGRVGPYSWSNGGQNGEMFGVDYQVWLDYSEVASIKTFIDGSNTTFDSTGTSATIKAVLYMGDGNGNYNILLESAPVDVVQSMANSWLEIPFQLDGFSEFLPVGDYIAGIQIVDYNNQEVYFGEDGHTPQINYATRWYFMSGTYANQWFTITNYAKSPVIRLVFNGLDGVNEISDQIDVKMYPNPTTGIVTIKGIEIGTAYVYDVLGKIVSTQTVTNQVNLSDLEAGNYYVTIVTEKGTSTKQISLIK